MPFSFCERISSEQFEQQRYTESQKALCQLLDHIINDNMMNDKNKKMRLKMVFYLIDYSAHFLIIFCFNDNYFFSSKKHIHIYTWRNFLKRLMRMILVRNLEIVTFHH